MLLQRATSALGIVAMLAFGGAASAPASASSKQTGVHRAHARSVGAKPAPVRQRARLTTFGNSPRFVALVGDKDSGLGFYPLPWHYRVAAWRWKQKRAWESAEALRAAVASTAIYSYGYGFPGAYTFGHRHGVFNPVDGYGTPFFAGYYSGGGDGDPGPFGSPYDN